MLTKIKVKNYTTFINETILDLEATNSKILNDTNTKNKITKGVLLIGENASGKTQLLDSVVMLLDLLFSNQEANYIVKKSLYTKGKSFSLEYHFKIDKKHVKYKIEFVDNEINEEKLLLDDELMLERLGNTGKVYFEDEQRIVEDINSSLSLLKNEYYITKFNNNEFLLNWFDFLKNSVYISCLSYGVNFKIYNPLKLNEIYLSAYSKKNDESKLNSFLSNIGYNSEIVFEKIKKEDVLVTQNKIFLRKKGTNVKMPLNLESTGNKALMHIFLPIIYATKNNCMLIIDEFSSGLHNELEESLIRYFFNNSDSSQLLFTSHSTNILDTDILRPDQIYSLEFDSEKGSKIKRFSDENPRESQNIEKMYLNGVFNGMPKYSKKFTDK